MDGITAHKTVWTDWAPESGQMTGRATDESLHDNRPRTCRIWVARSRSLDQSRPHARAS